jgi:hypothetical protein
MYVGVKERLLILTNELLIIERVFYYSYHTFKNDY